MSLKKKLEAKLSYEKRKAALACAMNEIMPEDGAKKTQAELAEELGMSRMGLYRWRTQDPVFIEYMGLLADEMLASHQAEVYGQLMRSIRGRQPSMKAIEIYTKLIGKLADRQIITDNTSDNQTIEDINALTNELDDLLKEE
ncbi:phBC6A51 family helix-turn-helix protein [Niallia circulans]|uniref:phBC6A51 family helix-turn-helix protein n=1 Tax=Niallia circulans TaxID=1397 RepID=UPI0026EE6E4C|nr:phBC6A51 family helix-turn-helix protein [Niallia circulans]